MTWAWGARPGLVDGEPVTTTADGSWISFGKKETARRELERGLSRVKDP